MRDRQAQNHAHAFRIERVTETEDAALRALIARSDAYLEALYPPESNHTESPEQLVADGSNLFAGRMDGQLVATGAVKIVDGDIRYGEIKRVFVDDSQRGKGLATRMMAHLEQYLFGLHITTVRLEAGPRQPEALKLYEKLGYRYRGPFGSYTEDPLSTFMEKQLLADEMMMNPS